MDKQDYIDKLKKVFEGAEDRIDNIELSQVDIDHARETLKEAGHLDDIPDEAIEDISRLAAKAWIREFRKALEDNGDKIIKGMLDPNQSLEDIKHTR